jgi:hypothetical protein
MSLVSGKVILDAANEGGYAVGAFNINNMEILQAAKGQRTFDLFRSYFSGQQLYTHYEEVLGVIARPVRSVYKCAL